MDITAIAAIGKNRVIGREQGLPWNIPEDFRHFKQVTMGATLIMGRVTFGSIGKPLPGRISVVVSRAAPDRDYADLPPSANGSETRVIWVHSLKDALQVATGLDRPVFIGGGASIYEQAWPYLTELDITEVDAEPDGDRFFPVIDPAEWREISRDPREGFDFVRYTRIQPAGGAS
jgi:dihydrofolate reductase